MRRHLLVLLLGLAAAAGALADTWTPASGGTQLTPTTGRYTYSYVNADGSTPTAEVDNRCGALMIEFDPGTGGGGTVQGCADATCTTPTTIATLSATMAPGPYVSAMPMLRVNRTAPSSGTAIVYLRCVEQTANIELRSNTSITAQIDADNNGTEVAQLKNGAGTVVVSTDENGDTTFGSPTNPATTGNQRLSNNAPGICWRNAANSANLCGTVNGSDETVLPGPLSSSAAAATPAADDNDTSVATSAFVQGEINGAGGRSVTCASGSCDVDAELYTRTCDFAVEAPVAGDDGDLQCYLPTAATLVRVYCSTDTGTSVINLYERAEASPNTGTTDMLTSDLTCDTDGQATTTFTDSALAADALLALGLQTTFTSGWVRVHVEYTVND